jgi:hypothetical protein
MRDKLEVLREWWKQEVGSDKQLDPYVLARIIREAREHELLPPIHDL